MKDKQTGELINKCMRVILSCKNYDQLNNATNYCDLAYKILTKQAGTFNRTIFNRLMQRSIGYALCEIQNNKVN